ncbi:MAG: hypothetical protein HMLKMBBP_01417 [Planctomycetes bacterium]|nr:hypothetical protein [Planctomycetota bacterium]
MTNDSGWTPRHVRILHAIVAAGMAFRAVRLAWNPSLYTDALALNVTERGFGDLLRPLEYVQAAPPLHLLLVKIATTLLGDGETALRAVPFAAGCGALVLFASWTRRVLEPAAGLVATAILATAWRMIDYTALEKHYASDVLACSALLLLANRATTGRRTFALAAACAVAPWLSFPASFVVLPILAARWIAGAPGVRVRDAAAVGLPWLVSASVLHGIVLPQMTPPGPMRAWWIRDFVPIHDPVSIPGWLASHLPDAFGALVAPPDGAIVSAVATAAVAVLAVEALRGSRARSSLAPAPDRRAAWVLLAGPVALALAASALQQYPFAHRHLYFAAPAVAALSGFLFADALRGTRLRRAAALVLIAAVLLPNAAKALYTAVRPPAKQDIRTLVADIARAARSGDCVIATPTALQVYRYYAARIPAAASLELRTFSAPPEDAAAVLTALRSAAPAPRVWLVFAIAGREDHATRDSVRAALETSGALLETCEAAGATAFAVAPARVR